MPGRRATIGETRYALAVEQARARGCFSLRRDFLLEPAHIEGLGFEIVIRRQIRFLEGQWGLRAGSSGALLFGDELGTNLQFAIRLDSDAGLEGLISGLLDSNLVIPDTEDVRCCARLSDIEAVEPAPAPAEASAEEAVDAEPPPSFTRPKRRKARSFSVVFGGGSVLLALLAAVQLTVIFRGELMIHWPQSRPALAELCAVFRCTVNWPTQADQLAVIGTELQAIAGTDALELTAVIRNRAGFKQALPAVEVTLMDARNRALARKVFTPADYLASAGEASSRLQEGFAPGGDFTIRILFEARGLTPAGFLVYPFYL